ncbi:hypothetical protein C2S53_007142 [Perilla frutescens var. hirtella]|uniref:F-box associated beta-propeller type 3 domain-containing protein n=1 Tax=Perilla frutescens var. hirtella TaxID=608512 RepID=A0AAD4ING1_PERFH|nr:hypothetical protein C2S53_007142 [Perilla frutescens var. hirtella]
MSSSSSSSAILRQMMRPKPTTSEAASYIITPSPAAADPDHHNNTVKYLLKRVRGDTTATGALHFSANEIPNKAKFTPLGIIFDSPYFDKTNSIGCSVGRWLHLQTFNGESLLWDPSTDDVVSLPSHKAPPRAYKSHLMSSCLGFDSTSQDFKLIKLMQNLIQNGGVKEQAVLYSLKRDSWKDITRVAAKANALGADQTPAYVNGVCYWADTNSITAFDFAKERFSKISLPDGFAFGDTHVYKVVEFEGLLGVIVYPKSGKDKRFELWVRDIGSKAWVRKWSVDVCGGDMALGLSGNGEILFVQAVDHELIECELAAKEVKKVGIHGLMWKMALMPYVERGSVSRQISGKSQTLKAKMHVTKAQDFLFACADKWKITYDGEMGCMWERA